MNRFAALASLSVALSAGIADLAALPSAEAAPLLAEKGKAKARKNVVKTAAADPSCSTLVAAAKNITVFAPTNEAFEALPAGTLETLRLPENREQLKAILTYHVLPSKAKAADVTSGDVPTLNAAPLSIEVADGSVTAGGATVIATDVKANNGVIHVVSSVILSPSN